MIAHPANYQGMATPRLLDHVQEKVHRSQPSDYAQGKKRKSGALTVSEQARKSKRLRLGHRPERSGQLPFIDLLNSHT
jgi:hypothetical protein